MTTSERAGLTPWIHGGSPTTGFLKFGTEGPLADFYKGFAGANLGLGRAWNRLAIVQHHRFLR